MAVSKKAKRSILIGIGLLLFGWFWYMRNPNNKKWIGDNGTVIDVPTYPMKWSLFSNAITVGNNTSLKGVLSGNKISWNNGTSWTY